MICDFAEYYHILDYRSLQPPLCATLAAGLCDDSRIKRRISDQRYPNQIYFLAGIADRLSVLTWNYARAHSKKDIKKPKLLLEELDKDRGSEIKSFNTAEEFEEIKRKILYGD